jgi:protein-S-isoprenylcysteine O-methyltransferase Ste14
MYVAWTILYLGIAFVANNLWMFILLPIVLIYTHRFVIQKEERELLANFGDEYQHYLDEVPRYL